MTIDEFMNIAKGIKANYGNKVTLDSYDNLSIWYGMLKDLDYRITEIAVQRYMAIYEYPPTIAAIRKQYRDLTEPKQLEGMEAWSFVSKAIRNSGYNEVAEFEVLPPLVQKAIGSAGNLHSMAIDENYNEGVARSNFLKQYQIVCERKMEESCIPERIKLLTEKTMKHQAEHLEENKAGNKSIEKPADDENRKEGEDDEYSITVNGDGDDDGGSDNGGSG